MPIRILIADDHSVVRQGLRMFLGLDNELEIIGEASDGTEAVKMAHELRPDVVLMDMSLPDGSGTDATVAVLRASPGTRVLVLSASSERDDVLGAVKAGASGYLVKSASAAELVEAVAATAAGQAVFTPGLAGLVLGEYRRMSATADRRSPAPPRGSIPMSPIRGSSRPSRSSHRRRSRPTPSSGRTKKARSTSCSW